MVFQAVAMRKAGRIAGPLHIQFVMDIKNAMPVDREVFDFYVKTLNRLAPGATWTGAGIVKDQLTLAKWSLELGGHCRTGLEDNVRLDRDTLAPSNASLVAQISGLCERASHRVATPQEARSMPQLSGTPNVAAPPSFTRPTSPTLEYGSRRDDERAAAPRSSRRRIPDAQHDVASAGARPGISSVLRSPCTTLVSIPQTLSEGTAPASRPMNSERSTAT